MFSQNARPGPSAAGPPLGAPQQAMSTSGTLDESVSDTLKRDALRCDTRACKAAGTFAAGAERTRCALCAVGLRTTCARCSCRASPAARASRCGVWRLARWAAHAAPCGCGLRTHTLLRRDPALCSARTQGLRDWDLWGPLVFTMTLVRHSLTRAALSVVRVPRAEARAHNCSVALSRSRLATGGAAVGAVARARVRLRRCVRRGVHRRRRADAERAAAGARPSVGSRCRSAAPEPLRRCRRHREAKSSSSRAWQC
jgi:hypothetical protein